MKLPSMTKKSISHMNNKNVCAIILCAGKGTRMNDESTNKVCFEVAGVPVIKRVVS